MNSNAAKIADKIPPLKPGIFVLGLGTVAPPVVVTLALPPPGGLVPVIGLPPLVVGPLNGLILLRIAPNPPLGKKFDSKSPMPNAVRILSNIPPPPSSPCPGCSSLLPPGPLVPVRPAESFVLSNLLSALANFACSNAFLLISVCASTESLIIVRDPVVLVDCSRLALDNA